jgi:acetylornithine deacetylase/succinyl-diaminopimelate desuccinylase-like protein
VGGFSTTVRDRRVYLVQAAEKGMAWLRLTARGPAGHGSMLQPDNAVDGIVAPYMTSGGTDGKHWSRLGMRCYGYSPLNLPADFDFTALFHGVDERVPVESLTFGARVLDDLLDRLSDPSCVRPWTASSQRRVRVTPILGGPP